MTAGKYIPFNAVTGNQMTPPGSSIPASPFPLPDVQGPGINVNNGIRISSVWGLQDHITIRIDNQGTANTAPKSNILDTVPCIFIFPVWFRFYQYLC